MAEGKHSQYPDSDQSKDIANVRRATIATAATIATIIVGGLVQGAREAYNYYANREPDAKAKVASVVASSNVLQGLVNDGCGVIPSLYSRAPGNSQIAKMRDGRLSPNDYSVVPGVTRTIAGRYIRNFSSPVSRRVIVRSIGETVEDTRSLPLTRQTRTAIDADYRGNVQAGLEVAASREESVIQWRLEQMREAINGLDDGSPLMSTIGTFVNNQSNLGITQDYSRPAQYSPALGIESVPPLTLQQAWEQRPQVFADQDCLLP